MASGTLVNRVYNRYIPPIAAPSVNYEVVGGSTFEYKYKITAINETGETNADFITVQGPDVLSGLAYVRLYWHSTSTARRYKIYGRTALSFGFLAEVTDTEYIDYGVDVAVEAIQPPATNTTGRMDWDSVAFIPGRGLQSAELNEVQSIQEESIKRIGDTLFADGDIIKGCSLGITGSPGQLIAKIEEGFLYVRGKVRWVEATDLPITGQGTELIGVTVEELFEDEEDDIVLKDPAQEFPGYASSGALRKKVKLTWVRKLEADVANVIFIYKLVDGGVFLYRPTPSYSVLEHTLARKVEDISGATLIDGFSAVVIPHSERRDKVVFEIRPGKAYVEGYELNKPSVTKLQGNIAIETSTTENATIDDSEGYLYTPDIVPIKKVISCSRTVLRIANRVVPASTGGGCAANWYKDELPETEISTIVKIIKDSVEINPADYALSGRNVCLNSAVFSSGQTYTIHYVYLTSASKTVVRRETQDDNFTFLTAQTDYELSKKNLVLLEKFKRTITVGQSNFSDLMLIKDEDNKVYFYGRDFVVDTGQYSTVMNPIIYFIGNRSPANNKTMTVYYTYWKVITSGDYKSVDSYLEPSDMYADYSYDCALNVDKIDFRESVNKPADLLINSDISNTVDVDMTTRFLAYHFTASRTGYISSIVLKLKKSGVITGSSTVTIQLWSGSVTTVGRLLYSSTTELPIRRLTTSYQNILFDLRAYVVSGSTYWIVVQCNKTGEGTIQIRGASTVTDTAKESNDGFTWTNRDNKFYYEVYINFGIRIDYEYFLNQTGWLLLDKAGNFLIEKSSPSLKPLLLNKPFGYLPRYQLFFPAFSQYVQLIEDKNYKVLKQHDLNILRNRVENVEYNTAMTALELEAYSKYTGAYKKALFTEPFVDVSRISLGEIDGVGISEGKLTLHSFVNQIQTKIDINGSSGVHIGNQLITLPYTQTPYLSQLVWTEEFAQSINPYSSYGPITTIELYPRADFHIKEITYEDVVLRSDIETGDLITMPYEAYSLPIEEILKRIAAELGINVNRILIVKKDSAGRPILIRYIKNVASVVISDSKLEYLPYMRTIDVLVYAMGCPTNEGNIYLLFDNKEIPLLIATQGDITSKNLSFIPRGTQDGQNRIRADNTGRFVAKFTVPNETRCGEAKIEIKSSSGLVDAVSDYHGVSMARHLKRIQEITTYYKEHAVYFSPLAETFIADYNFFISSIDIWFYRVPVANDAGIRVAIRGTDNGYPAREVHGESFKSKQEIISEMANGDVTEIGKITSNGVLTNPTISETNGRVRFTFASPVFLEKGKEYCFSIEDSAPGYFVYTCCLGKKVLGDLDGKVAAGSILDKQVHNGNMFISANNIAWEIDQKRDITFRINKAQFTANQDKYLYFEEYNTPVIDRTGNLVSGSNQVTINSENLVKGMKVSGTGIPQDSYITLVEFNKITLNKTATETGSYGLSFKREYSKFLKTMSTKTFVDTKLDHEFSISAGVWNPYQNQEFTQDKTLVENFEDLVTMTDKIKFRSLLRTSNANVSPIINRVFLEDAMLSYLADSAKYITQNQVMTTSFSNIKIWIDETTNTEIFGTSKYQISFDDGLAWYPAAGFTKTTFIDLEVFKEYEFGGSLSSITEGAVSVANQFKIRIEYSHKDAYRFYTPEFGRLRVVVY